MTLLKMVNKLLSDINSEVVNTLEDDDVEANQIASILEDVFYEIVNTSDKRHLGTLFKMEAGQSSLPSSLTIPIAIKKIEWIRYNKKRDEEDHDRFEDVMYLDPVDFLSRLELRKSTWSNVTEYTTEDGVPLNIFTDVQPTFWTSFDDNLIVFDSFDSEVDSALIPNKSKVYGFKEPEFIIQDNFIPDLPSEMFSFYLSKARSIVFNDLAQTPNAKAEQRERQTRHYMGVEGWRAKGGLKRNYYGRNPRKQLCR